MSIDAEEAAIRTVIVGALMGHSEAGERGFDALSAVDEHAAESFLDGFAVARRSAQRARA
jgi:hypothetical protein